VTTHPTRLAAWLVVLALAAPAAGAQAAPTDSSAAAIHATKKKRKKRRRPRLTHVDGDIVGMRYGAVQVRVYFRGRRIVDVRKLKHPEDIERSRQIGADAMPKLRQKVLAAQSARIDGVSGATYTSAAYKQSVQSALDLA
jgi:uncharacterized protein with FMN-binding domain